MLDEFEKSIFDVGFGTGIAGEFNFSDRPWLVPVRR